MKEANPSSLPLLKVRALVLNLKVSSNAVIRVIELASTMAFCGFLELAWVYF
jgi:hypothetical protein